MLSNRLVDKSGHEYHLNKVADAPSNPKALFKIVRTLMYKETCTVLTTCQSLDDLTVTFNKFFLDKVHKITPGLRSIQSKVNTEIYLHYLISSLEEKTVFNTLCLQLKKKSTR